MKLMRLHYKLRKLKMDVNDKRICNGNTKQLCKNPFDFIKEKILNTGQKMPISPDCNIGPSFVRTLY